MRLKLDENPGRRAAETLRAAGHDVSTVAEQDMRRASDRTLIEACQRDGRCLVTMDMEFANPLLFRPGDYPGIVVLRLPARPTLSDLYDGVQTLVGGLERESIDGKLWVVQRGRIREYQPEEETDG